MKSTLPKPIQIDDLARELDGQTVGYDRDTGAIEIDTEYALELAEILFEAGYRKVED